MARPANANAGNAGAATSIPAPRRARPHHGRDTDNKPDNSGDRVQAALCRICALKRLSAEHSESCLAALHNEVTGLIDDDAGGGRGDIDDDTSPPDDDDDLTNARSFIDQLPSDLFTYLDFYVQHALGSPDTAAAKESRQLLRWLQSADSARSTCAWPPMSPVLLYGLFGPAVLKRGFLRALKNLAQAQPEWPRAWRLIRRIKRNPIGSEPTRASSNMKGCRQSNGTWECWIITRAVGQLEKAQSAQPQPDHQTQDAQSAQQSNESLHSATAPESEASPAEEWHSDDTSSLPEEPSNGFSTEEDGQRGADQQKEEQKEDGHEEEGQHDEDHQGDEHEVSSSPEIEQSRHAVPALQDNDSTIHDLFGDDDALARSVTMRKRTHPIDWPTELQKRPKLSLITEEASKDITDLYNITSVHVLSPARESGDSEAFQAAADLDVDSSVFQPSQSAADWNSPNADDLYAMQSVQGGSISPTKRPHIKSSPKLDEAVEVQVSLTASVTIPVDAVSRDDTEDIPLENSVSHACIEAAQRFGAQSNGRASWLDDTCMHATLLVLDPDFERHDIVNPVYVQDSSKLKLRNTRPLVIVPVHVNGNHWNGVIVDRATRTIEVYDPYQKADGKTAEALVRRCLASHLPDLEGYERTSSTYIPNTLFQPDQDTNNCGIFVLLFLLCRMHRQPLPRVMRPGAWRQFFHCLLVQDQAQSTPQVLQLVSSEAETIAGLRARRAEVTAQLSDLELAQSFVTGAANSLDRVDEQRKYLEACLSNSTAALGLASGMRPHMRPALDSEVQELRMEIRQLKRRAAPSPISCCRTALTRAALFACTSSTQGRQQARDMDQKVQEIRQRLLDRQTRLATRTAVMAAEREERRRAEEERQKAQDAEISCEQKDIESQMRELEEIAD